MKARTIFNSMVQNSRRLGLPAPEFSQQDILKIILRGSCSITGIPFNFDPPPATQRTNPFSPSPDRINPREGYTRANVQWVCWIYNTMKSDFPAEAVEKFIVALVTKHQPQVTQ